MTYDEWLASSGLHELYRSGIISVVSQRAPVKTDERIGVVGIDTRLGVSHYESAANVLRHETGRA